MGVPMEDELDDDARVAAAAMRDAIDALEHERPDLAEQLRTLLAVIEGDDPASGASA
jgi:hypothetical protein